MRTAYFDIISGISGDMTLGAFISAGISVDDLNSELQKLKLSGFELSARHINRNGIYAVQVEVIVSDQPHYHRHPKDIEKIIDESSLSVDIKNNAKKIFQEVAAAEAKVHNTDIEKVHFHEVGAIDSIVDIVGTAICLDKLGIQSIYTSAVKVGNGGTVDTQHGKLPVPAPAAIEILKNYPVVFTRVPFELTTPTGAAIVKALSKGSLDMERFRVSAIGYGAGSRDIEQLPNLLRIFIGELEPEYHSDEIVSIETNIDNMNPEIYPFVVEKLLNAGAHDAYLIPIVMKKGRPGILLSVLSERAKIDLMLEIIFSETTTLGVRIQQIERKKLSRAVRQVNTTLGIINAKVISVDGKEHLRAEFEECKRIALEKRIPIAEVYQILAQELSS